MERLYLFNAFMVTFAKGKQFGFTFVHDLLDRECVLWKT